MSISSTVRPIETRPQNWYPRSVMESRRLIENPSIAMYLKHSTTPKKDKILAKRIRLDSHCIEKRAKRRDKKSRRNKTHRIRSLFKETLEKPATAPIASFSAGSPLDRTLSASTASGYTVMEYDELDAFIDKFNKDLLPNQGWVGRDPLERQIVKLEQTKDLQRIRDGLFKLLHLKTFEAKLLVLNKLRRYLIPSGQENGDTCREELEELMRISLKIESFIQQVKVGAGTLEFVAHLIKVYRDVLAQIWVLSLWEVYPIEVSFIKNVESNYERWRGEFNPSGDDLMEESLLSLKEVIEKFGASFAVEEIKERSGRSCLFVCLRDWTGTSHTRRNGWFSPFIPQFRNTNSDCHSV